MSSSSRQVIQSVRGMHDIYGEDAMVFDYVVNVAKTTASLFNFNTLHLPVVEFANLYLHNLGEETDIVSKEMYVFKDRNEDSLALRPEFTAGVARFFGEHGMQSKGYPLKMFSYGPLFRYERPQKGRYRQFNQINFEIIGSAGVKTDVLAIVIASHFLKFLGNTKLNINFLADEETRRRFKHVLQEYLRIHINQLSDDSKKRLENNPLRILDSKAECDKELLKNAPTLEQFYTDQYKEEIAKTLSILDQSGIIYTLNPLLVRGIDYYDGLVFEFISTDDSIGAQSTVLGGGRYSRLLQSVSGVDVSSIGFAAGIERLCMLSNVKAMAMKQIQPKVAIIPVSDDYFSFVCRLVQHTIFNCDIIVADGSISKKIQKADTAGCKYIIVCGKEEKETGIFTVKNLKTGEEMVFSDLKNLKIV